MKELMKISGVMRVTGDQCMYGLKSKDGDMEGPARKRTGFLTNSVCVAKQLTRKCPNSSGYTVHHHIRLEGGRTKQAQVYPRELCEAICKGLEEQIKADEAGQFLPMESANEGTTSRELLHTANTIIEQLLGCCSLLSYLVHFFFKINEIFVHRFFRFYFF